jgi:glycosyltransferase involved in cell wall biosynthesis
VRVLYDGYIYQLQKAGGVNRYFSELISRLPADFQPCLYTKVQPHLYPPAQCHLSRRKARALPEWAGWARRFIIPQSDLFHPTYYHLSEPLRWCDIHQPVVLTVYDFVFRRYSHLYERSAKLLEAQAEAIRRADLILCISESTRCDLLEGFPECESRSVVIHLAATPLPEAASTPPQAKPYFLFVGARVFYKNFQLAVEGIAELRRQGFDVDLLVAGPGWSEPERAAYAASPEVQFIRLHNFASDAELATLYRHAVGLIYPSEYEGFGLPVLEAMAFGTPVIALRTSSIPEVAGQAALLLEPSEATPDALAVFAGRLLTDSDFRAGLALRSAEQIRKFSWDKTARKVWLTIDTVIRAIRTYK